MTIRTEEEILSELAQLLVLKPTVVEFDYFGVSSHKAIQHCIDILKYNPFRIEIIRLCVQDLNTYSSPMLWTRDWLDCRESEPPSECGWPLKPQPEIHTHTDCLLDR